MLARVRRQRAARVRRQRAPVALGLRDDRHLVNEHLAIRAAGTLVGAVPDLLGGEIVRATGAAHDFLARKSTNLSVGSVEQRPPKLRVVVLTPHLTFLEGQGKEVDLVILPWVHRDNFEEDAEARQLLYVSLSRARHQLLVRMASGAVPTICQRLGLA